MGEALGATFYNCELMEILWETLDPFTYGLMNDAGYGEELG